MAILIQWKKRGVRKINRSLLFFYTFTVAIFFLSLIAFYTVYSSEQDFHQRPPSQKVHFEKILTALELVDTVAASERLQHDLSQIRVVNQAESWCNAQHKTVLSYPFPEIVTRYEKSAAELWQVLDAYSEGSTLSDKDVLLVKKNSRKMQNLIQLLAARVAQTNSVRDGEKQIALALHFAVGTSLLFFVTSLLLFFLYQKKLLHLQQAVVKSFSPQSTSSAYQEVLDNSVRKIDETQKELQRLRIIQNRFQRMFDALPVGVVAFDKTGVVLVANRLFSDTFFKAASPVGELFDVIMSPAKISQKSRGKIAWQERQWWISEYTIESSSYLVFQDVTEQEKMAAKLLNSERLVSIGEMASRITHEIRNPLSTIKMNSEYMREHAYEMTREEIESTFKPVINEIIRLEQITDKYINMVKYRSTVEVASAVIPDDLAELISFHRPEMEARNIELDVTFPDKPLSLSIPVDAFREVLLNIMKNGWEEIERDGRMHIRVIVVSDTLLEIHIEDSGSGIDEMMKEKIFETFFTGKAGGTGIGLSHSKTLVTENNGTITVEDSELGGADFVISMTYDKIV
ncbi:hypothetical protein KAH37_05150 [bacterium]|nr:hypothetical protein [bacterium]